MSGFNLARWSLNVYGPENEPAEEGSAYQWAETDARVLGMLPGLMVAAAEDLADLLPDGYTVKAEPDAA